MITKGLVQWNNYRVKKEKARLNEALKAISEFMQEEKKAFEYEWRIRNKDYNELIIFADAKAKKLQYLNA